MVGSPTIRRQASHASPCRSSSEFGDNVIEKGLHFAIAPRSPNAGFKCFKLVSGEVTLHSNFSIAEGDANPWICRANANLTTQISYLSISGRRRMPPTCRCYQATTCCDSPKSQNKPWQLKTRASLLLGTTPPALCTSPVAIAPRQQKLVFPSSLNNCPDPGPNPSSLHERGNCPPDLGRPGIRAW